jgi:hypothetical protein
MTKNVNGWLLAVLLLIAGCGGEPESQTGAGQPDMSADTTRMPMMPMPMMGEMNAHMQAMQGLTPDSVRALLPGHARMADSVFAEMERRMREMNMPRTTEMSAVMDSLRQDMMQMRGMSDAELTSAMPAHMARMRRLMEMQGGGGPSPN